MSRAVAIVMLGMLVCVVDAESSPAQAQTPPPVIHSVSVRADTGVLIIQGTGLGADLQVTVDGQPVTVLPGASATLMEALAPAKVLSVAGTYRLTVGDPSRQAWDAFVVASPASLDAANAGVRAATPDGATAVPAAARERPGTPAIAADVAAPARSGVSGPAPNLVEEGNSPYRTAVGSFALISPTGLYNTAVGYEAGWNTSSGARNTGIGARALSATFSGSDSTGVGYKALYVNRGSDNTAVGSEALSANVSATGATAVGARALASNTTLNNTAVGFEAATSNTTGNAITALGARALTSNTTGDSNTAVGVSAMLGTTTGGSNTAVGTDALRANLTGAINVALGTGAVARVTNADANTGLGAYALGNATGEGNTAIGYSAGESVTTGRYNIHIGATVYGTSTDTNVIRIGAPYSAATLVGQNQTFIAGIRGTTVSGADGVYIDANGKLGSGPVVPAANTVGSAQVIAESLTAADLAPGSVGSSEILDGSVTAVKVAFSFAGLGANTFAGTQTIGSGNLDLAPSSATAGGVTKNGVRFLHDTGSSNTFLGDSAGNFALTGAANTGTGDSALQSLTSGGFNVASGAFALLRTTTGAANTAVGYRALTSATTGANNTALGRGAGGQATVGSYNVYLGADVAGNAADGNTMRLGLPYDGTTGAGQNRTFIAGIAGTVLTTPAVQVFVDANGQLGTLTPAPITGSVNGTVTPGTTPPGDAALQRELAAQRALLDAQAAVIAELRARVIALEASSRSPRGPR